ncbi:hypothetical protein ACFC26_12415 [Kitasatospora purpeofusca]|uniref:hypothetical protein n=1 Tax=Kitasatospora purpeofusca TaxID=67352 RepID=UPI0035D7E57D
MANVTVELNGGPLDGMETQVDTSDPDPWVAVVSGAGCRYPGGRSVYAPDPVTGRWV